MSGDEVLKFRISEVEKKIGQQSERLQKTDEQISAIKTDIAETNAYVKQIYDEIRNKDRGIRPYMKAGRMWTGVIVEMIRAIIIISGIIAGIKLGT